MAVTVLIKRKLAFQERIDTLTSAEIKFEIYTH